MRIFSAIMVWVIIISLVVSFKGYSSRHALSAAIDDTYEKETSGLSYTLELTSSFAPAADPYALTVDGQPSLLRISLAGKEIPVDSASLRPGKPLTIEITGIAIGWNELLIQASPQITEEPASQVIRAVVYANGALLADSSFWSVPGGTISGVLRFEVQKKEAEHAGH